MQNSIPRSYIPAPKGRPCRIAVFADSHANDTRFSAAIAIAADTGTIDAALHLGDHASDISLLHVMQPEWPVFAVRGNNDYFDKNVADEILLFAGDFGLLASHGHHYSASQRAERLAERAASYGAKMACFGHSHVAFLEQIDGIWVLNPGSVSYPREANGPSFAIVTIAGEQCSVDIIRTDNY